MHNNFYFLNALSQALHQRLQHWTLETCFCQNKDELILGFCSEMEQLYIRAFLSSEISFLAFPEEFNRARRNSIDLFPEIVGSRVTHVEQMANERSFVVHLQPHYKLLFKMHGNRSNIVLFGEENEVLSVFKHSLANDYQIVLENLPRTFDFSKPAFEAANGQVKQLFPTLGAVPLAYLQQQNYADLTLENQWNVWQKTLSQLQENRFFVGMWQGKTTLSLLPIFAETAWQSHDAIEAANYFASHYSQKHFADSERNTALKLLYKRLEQTRNYVEKTEAKWLALESTVRYDEIGHILMANLHAIPPRTEKITLDDFYRNQPIEIKLKADLSPQRNAENYYRKAKNQKIETEKLYENLAKKTQELEKIKVHIAFIENNESVKEIRKYLRDNHIISDKQKEEQVKPFRSFVFEGWNIWVGKNAQHNDELTQKYSHKDDLWLHARDVSGSHVLLKHQSGKKFPSHVIERAAALAAYYSKRKTDTLCPVICTPKKFVRKMKGTPAGSVIVEKEEVILVKPQSFEENP